MTARPLTPFDNARFKVQRAELHLAALFGCVRAFFNSEPCSVEITEDPDTGKSVLVVNSSPLPTDISLILGDTVHNLRSALDLLICGLVVAAGGKESNCQFPFARTTDDLLAAKGMQEIQKHTPHLVDLIVNSIQPCKDGNRLLWGLHELDILDKHRLLISVAGVSVLQDVEATGDKGGRIHFAEVRVGPGGIINLVQASEKLHITRKGAPSLTVMFAHGQPFEGQRVLPTLTDMSMLVRDVIGRFEAR